jgi:hypothetical protein
MNTATIKISKQTVTFPEDLQLALLALLNNDAVPTTQANDT